jgi:indolepyruvate ferredoxin oxidoreductase
VTVAQILATAAVMTGQHVRTLDQTGLAQKGGAVVSDLIIGDAGEKRSPKLADGECDLYLGCVAIVAAEAANLRTSDPNRTIAVVSTSPVPTGEMVLNPTVIYPPDSALTTTVRSAARRAVFLDAGTLATRALGDEQYANVALLGVAYQTGAVPIPAEAIEAAIRLNGAAVESNLAAFRIGRRTAIEVHGAAPTAVPESLDALIADREADLVQFQSRRYAATYRDLVDRVRARELALVGDEQLTRQVARWLYKVMAYKDEYEVARLSLDRQLGDAIAREFGPGAAYRYRLHPPALRALGMKSKISLGRWIHPVFRVLVTARRLRGTPLDPFGRATVRVAERALLTEYRTLVERLLTDLTPGNHEIAVEIAGLPDLVRGYEEIKLRNIELYKDRLAELLERHTAASTAPESRRGARL